MRVLSVVVVRGNLFRRERDVVAGGIELDVEDQAERRIAQREPERAQQIDHRARFGRRSGDHDRAVAAEGLEHPAPRHLVGDRLMMIEALDLVLGSPQSRRPSTTGPVDADLVPFRRAVRRAMATGPLDAQLAVDDIDRADRGRNRLRPRLPTTFVGLHDATLVHRQLSRNQSGKNVAEPSVNCTTTPASVDRPRRSRRRPAAATNRDPCRSPGTKLPSHASFAPRLLAAVLADGVDDLDDAGARLAVSQHAEGRDHARPWRSPEQTRSAH